MNRNLQQFDADEYNGGDDAEFAQEEDEVSDRVDGCHPQSIARNHVVGLVSRPAEITTVNGCNYTIINVCNKSVSDKIQFGAIIAINAFFDEDLPISM